jgi:hypothetical protein
MGRMGGASGALKKLKQKRAAQLGVPMHRVGMAGVARTSGLRVDTRSKAKPGFTVKIQPRSMIRTDRFSGLPVYTKSQKGTAPDLNTALKQLKKVDAKFLTMPKKGRR